MTEALNTFFRLCHFLCAIICFSSFLPWVMEWSDALSLKLRLLISLSFSATIDSVQQLVA
jgi:hypothetical protein